MRTASLTVLCFLSLSAFAADSADTPKVDGIWKWTFTMPDGYKVEPQVRLKREGDTLTGSSRFRAGAPVAIQAGKVDGDTVTWHVVREHDGRKVTTRYEGKVKGDSIKGTVSSDFAGETRSYPWEARRTSESPEGRWTWEVAFGEFRSSYSVNLDVDGKKLKGKARSRDREYDISDGKWESGEVSFVVKRERDGVDLVSTYRGRLDGDTIRGTVDTAFGDAEPRPAEWIARRAED